MSDELGFESLDGGKDLRVQPKPGKKGPWLSKAIGCMILGIVSLAIGPFQYGIPGIICAIMAFSYYSEDKKIYNTDPEAYAKPYKYLKLGRNFAIFGLIVSILSIPLWYWYFTNLDRLY